ncbi:hypothetical protein [Nocardiopsis dassonvillei]|uniref:hypothetical protein n=1 Tax=Nocardiopsis dassonvillei TaxID=2014 RepID=UPI00157D441F|nr:hypothetical protein [Nocardiopsis dassonvillei]
MEETLTYFVVVFDRKHFERIDLQSFADEDRALNTLFEAEDRFSHNSDIEIVLLGARSLEDLRHTHGHYFRDRHRVSEEDGLLLAG